MSSTDCSGFLGGGGGGVAFGGGLRVEDDEAALDDAVLLRLASELEELLLFPVALREVGRDEKPSSSSLERGGVEMPDSKNSTSSSPIDKPMAASSSSKLFSVVLLLLLLLRLDARFCGIERLSQQLYTLTQMLRPHAPQDQTAPYPDP